MKTGTDLEPERAHVLHQGTRTLDRPPRTIESGEKAIARSVDFGPSELPQPAANEGVMSLEQLPPRRVPELSGFKRVMLGLRVPFILGSMAGMMLKPSKSMVREFGIPKSVSVPRGAIGSATQRLSSTTNEYRW